MSICVAFSTTATTTITSRKAERKTGAKMRRNCNIHFLQCCAIGLFSGEILPPFRPFPIPRQVQVVSCERLNSNGARGLR